MKQTARDAALEVLQLCRREGAWPDAALKKVMHRSCWDRRDAALCTHMVYGVMQNRMWLEFLLSQYSNRPLQSLNQAVLDILELGAYQILYLDRVPDSAAVNEAVELCKRKQAQAAPFVNGVLRRLSREKGQLPPVPGGPSAQELSLRYSHPQWLVEELLAQLSYDETQQLLAVHNEIAPVTVQVNSLRCTQQQLIRELTEQGVTVTPHPWLEGCLELSEAGNIERLSAFQKGWMQIQDPAARAAALAAGVQPGERVLDVCAAPGGKSFAMAMCMEDRGEILACDIHPHKLTLLEKSAERLGIHCIKTETADARLPRPEWREMWDTVVCDVPCSGLGIIRKKPDIRYKNPQELAALPGIQSAILENAGAYVRRGGVLLYSTCTVLPQENSRVIDCFLKAHPEFEQEPFTVSGQDFPGEVTFWPHRHRTDGFYICKMRKK